MAENEQVDYGGDLSLLDKTNHIFEILQFDAKQCKVMSIEELKITAPVVVVKIFEKIMGLRLDSHINESAFESNAEMILHVLKAKYGLHQNVTPALLIRGDITVLTQVMDILYKLATKNHHFFATSQNQSMNRSLTKEDQQTKKRVFNISARFNTNFTSTLNTTISTQVSDVQQSSQGDEGMWMSSREREEIRLQQQREEQYIQQQKEKQRLLSQPRQCMSPHQKQSRNIESSFSTFPPSNRNNYNLTTNSNMYDYDNSNAFDWKDTGRRPTTSVPEPQSVSESVSTQNRKPKEVYCYDTYSGYRVNPKLHAILIKKNNPDLVEANSIDNRNPLEVRTSSNTTESTVGGGTKLHLDRTMYTGTAKNLPCYRDMEPLDLLLTIEHSFKTKTGGKFTDPKQKEISVHHTTVADHVFKYIINMTHKVVKPHARVRVMRINAQRNRRKIDVENKEFAKFLEVQIAYKNENGQVYPNLLFSRHKTGQWPSIKVLDKRIRAFYSRINMQLHAIEGGDEADNEECLEPYPTFDVDFIKESKKQHTPEIINLFDARYLFSPQDDDEDYDGRDDGDNRNNDSHGKKNIPPSPIRTSHSSAASSAFETSRAPNSSSLFAPSSSSDSHNFSSSNPSPPLAGATLPPSHLPPRSSRPPSLANSPPSPSLRSSVHN